MVLLNDLSKLDMFTVGFGDMQKRLLQATENLAKAVPGWPPYNIVKTDENKYVIEVAVAGFARSDLEIELQDNKLLIRGATKNDEKAAYLHKGIADRAFRREFHLADTIEVQNAEIVNGLLKVWLENVIPDSKKPRKVDIDDGETKNKTSKKSDPQQLNG
jgi:molecular chaperone IbpA